MHGFDTCRLVVSTDRLHFSTYQLPLQQFHRSKIRCGRSQKFNTAGHSHLRKTTTAAHSQPRYHTITSFHTDIILETLSPLKVPF